jgi:hypothetical protein
MKKLLNLSAVILGLLLTVESSVAFKDAKSICPAPAKVLEAQIKNGNAGQFDERFGDLNWHVYNSEVRANTLKDYDVIVHGGGIQVTCLYSGTYKGEQTDRDSIRLAYTLKDCKPMLGK